MIDITLVRIDPADRACEAFFACLPPPEQQRANGIRRSDDRCRHVIARGAMRMLLGRKLGIAPGAVALTTAGRGKPVLDPVIHARDARQVHFNVTHAGEWAGLALAGYPVGIDIEQIRALDVAALAAQVFDPATCRRMAGQADPRAFFFKCWTASEARWKAQGVGLAGAEVPWSAAHADPAARVQPFDVAPGYYGAVCALGGPSADPPARMEITTWRAVDLFDALND